MKRIVDILLAAWVFACVVTVPFGISAGCAASQRTKTLDDVYTAALAAGSAFEAFDGQHQQAIVAAGLNKPAVDSELAAWRATQVKILQLLVVAYQAIDAANKANTDASVAGAVTAGAALAAELKKDGVL